MSNKATLYRMEMDDHVCPFGLRAKDLLTRKGYEVDDRTLTSRQEVDNLKEKLGVKTTPQVFIGSERIGGFDALEAHFGKGESDETSYFPVLSLFTVAALLTAGLAFNATQVLWSNMIMQFIGFSMCMLGLLKLQDVDSFANSFLGYDLLAKKYVPYAFVYPFAETLGGVLMVSGLWPALSMIIMLFIGGIGGVSVFKAVYIDKRELKCACVGGDSNVPLGAVSFLENAVMFAAGAWMFVQFLT
ncbi:MauE/DoxX family redox-associated membrane protein [Aestuariibacter salexigens]|uniref:MauE/DoxX family redox-associated membrane protein n=1 Tax=Aestuariibacter salexigens TaxID=226010 RepID=UPI000418FEEC|nr:MauE/DoxX family redox-associated membrane protein [Aestuariibacter salexigens]